MPQLKSFRSQVFLVLQILLIQNILIGQITWDQIMDVGPASSGNNRPRIVTNAAGHPLVIWGKASDLMYSRWDGNTFTTPVKLNPTGVTIASANWMGPEIAAHGDTVYIVYKETPEEENNRHIWCIRSIDGGQTFSAPVQVENTGDDKSRFPVVTTDDEGHPIIAFMRFNPSFLEARWVVTRSFDFGATFTPDVLASGWSSPVAEVCDCCPATIHASGENVAIVYRDNNQHLRDSWAGFSTDGGLTFTGGINIDQNGWTIHACPATGPDGVIIGDTLYSVFMNGQSGQSIVYYNTTSIPDISNPPSTAVPGTGEALQQNFPRIDASGQAVAMLWRHSANFTTNLALMFTDNISNGFPSSFDTVAFSQIANGDVAVTESKVFVAWQANNASNVRFRAGSYETSTSTKEYNNLKPLLLYPNPVSDELIMDAGTTTIKITDLSGQTLAIRKGNRMDVSTLPPGLYLVSTDIGWGKFVKL